LGTPEPLEMPMPETNHLTAKSRCFWASTPQMIAYHDEEWGVPQHDDRVLFEFLILEGAQAGLSWSTILNKRAAYRKAFSQFNPARIAKYDTKKLKQLMADPGIVRNRLKIAAAVQNAKAFLAVKKEFGSFDKYIWQFTSGTTIKNALKDRSQIQARTPESDAMSKDLLKRGFKFVGPTICYAFMQAVGMVNDHLVECFRYKEVENRL
jgi:DNA-3-methyladenine glycosylase I